MCIDVTDEHIYVAEADIRVWKVVTKDLRQSPYADNGARSGEGWRRWLRKYFSSRIPITAGRRLDYPVGATVKSKWPGLYCWATYGGARDFAISIWAGPTQVIECVIPKGAEFVQGTHRGYKAICARRIKVLT